MTHRFYFVFLAASFLGLLTACDNQNRETLQEDLVGSWVTDPIKTEWGTAILEVTFKTSSDVEFKMTPTEDGEIIVSSGKYHLSGSQLISEAINKGEPVPIRLEGKHLFFTSEPQQRFSRK